MERQIKVCPPPPPQALKVTHTHARTHARTNARTHARARARTHTHTHTHTHTLTHTHIHWGNIRQIFFSFFKAKWQNVIIAKMYKFHLNPTASGKTMGTTNSASFDTTENLNYFQIWDGNSTAEQYLRRMSCSYWYSWSSSSSGNTLLLLFQSDWNTTDTGFKMTWSAGEQTDNQRGIYRQYHM